MLSKGRAAAAARGGGAATAAAFWEVRPGGMLVQKRSSDVNQSSSLGQNIKVKVKYGSSYHEVNITPQASFGQLKKLLVTSTGLNPSDQKLVFKDRERDSKAYLDVAGVKDGSKMVLFEDVTSKEKKLLANLKTTKMDKAHNDIADISLDVDKLAKQVGNLELEICGGKKVTEKVLLNLIELLMSQLIKLDGIVAEGDLKLQRRTQVKKVQRYIETLDMLKIRNSLIKSDDIRISTRTPLRQQNKFSFEQSVVTSIEKQRDSMQRPIMGTTKWEKF